MCVAFSPHNPLGGRQKRLYCYLHFIRKQVQRGSDMPGVFQETRGDERVYPYTSCFPGRPRTLNLEKPVLVPGQLLGPAISVSRRSGCFQNSIPLRLCPSVPEVVRWVGSLAGPPATLVPSPPINCCLPVTCRPGLLPRCGIEVDLQ